MFLLRFWRLYRFKAVMFQKNEFIACSNFVFIVLFKILPKALAEVIVGQLLLCCMVELLVGSPCMGGSGSK